MVGEPPLRHSSVTLNERAALPFSFLTCQTRLLMVRVDGVEIKYGISKCWHHKRLIEIFLSEWHQLYEKEIVLKIKIDFINSVQTFDLPISLDVIRRDL